ncbi:MAG: hypothetical protein ABSE73_04780 [Planctomycetota bacterium]
MTKQTPTAEQLCAKANIAYERFGFLAQEADGIKTWFAQEFGLEPDSYRNPCDAHFEIGRVIENARRSLARFVIQNLGEMLVPNIPLNWEEVLRQVPACQDGFDANAVLQHIQKAYVQDAYDKSLQALLTKARRLLPHLGWKEERTLGQVVKKNVLTLHKYLHDGAGSRSFDPGCECDALQRVVRVVLEDADPVTVDTGATPISEIMCQRKGDEVLQEVTFSTGWIQKVRFHKNGKMLVTMKGETAAERVAKLLIEKPKTD